MNLSKAASAFGLQLTPQDLSVSVGLLSTSRNSPRELARRLPEIAALLERALPDTQVARQRLARFLAGLEYLLRAARVVVASDDPDLIQGLKTALRETSDEFFPAGKNPELVDLDRVNKVLWSRVEKLMSQVPKSQDPRVREAAAALIDFMNVLNPRKTVQRLPFSESVELDLFAPPPPRRALPER